MELPLQSELKACKTAASITEVVDGFEVLRTASVAETFRLYAAITKRLAVWDKLFHSCLSLVTAHPLRRSQH